MHLEPVKSPLFSSFFTLQNTGPKSIQNSWVIWAPGIYKLLMEKIPHQLRLVVYPSIYKILYIPGGAEHVSLPVRCSINFPAKIVTPN